MCVTRILGLICSSKVSAWPHSVLPQVAPGHVEFFLGLGSYGLPFGVFMLGCIGNIPTYVVKCRLGCRFCEHL